MSTPTPAQPVKAARQELEAMEAVLAAVESLPVCAARRVLGWVANVTEERFELKGGPR